MLKITKLTQQESVYDITVAGNENFYANGVLVHNCQEITLHVKPIENIDDEHGEIGTCILAAVNWGSIKTPEDFKKPCELLVRALDELIDLQTYPVKAAELFSKKRRALGIGITNFAYWLAKNDLTYQNIDETGLDLIHRFAEAWSYYLIKASVDLAIEFGHCEKWHETRYSSSVLPIDTAKLDAWELTPDTKLHLMQEWQQLRIQLACHGIRNSTLMALMPCETSSLVTNSTNGVEPPRALVSYKQSKDGVIAQVVPEIRRLKNKYDLLWDQKSPVGYLKIMAVLQKFVDQSISVNTSYNLAHYPNHEIPMSELLQHVLLAYKFGLKNLYYLNSHDQAGEVDTSTNCESCAV